MEKTIAVLVIVSFVLTSINSFILHVGFITREEAIEISRRTEIVQSAIEDADWHIVEVAYLNQTQVNRVREGNPYLRERYQKDGSVWILTWSFRPKGTVGPFWIVVVHIIDAETGQILREEQAGVGR